MNIENFARKIINIENVSYSYPREKKKALSNINLSIAKGEFLAVMGADGAGKTTFCKLLNGIIPHSLEGRLCGTVTVAGKNTAETAVPELACKAGLVLDDPDAQIFTSSVRREAAFGPENLLLPLSEIERRVNLALSVVGLSGFEDRNPATLSGGEKQRLAIASVLAMESEILVLDEPLARLDPQGAAEVMSVLRSLRESLREKYQLTIIMATNDSNKTAGCADRVCVLNNGQIVVCDETENIIGDSLLLEKHGIQPPNDTDIHSVFQIDNLKFADNAAVEIKDFYYSYDHGGASFNNINLSIRNNDFAAVIGRNGCGKTTLLKNITGLLRPTAGDIFIRGKNTKEFSVSAISKEIGFVMQNPDTQLFTDSVFNEISFALKNFNISKTEIKKRVKDALHTVGLEDLEAFPHSLCRADRTKVVIACVLAMGCKIIIFDEVDVGQDYRGKRQIMDIAKQLNAAGCTIIFVTHNIPLACEYAQRLIMLDRNGIVMDKLK